MNRAESRERKGCPKNKKNLRVSRFVYFLIIHVSSHSLSLPFLNISFINLACVYSHEITFGFWRMTPNLLLQYFSFLLFIGKKLAL